MDAHSNTHNKTTVQANIQEANEILSLVEYVADWSMSRLASLSPVGFTDKMFAQEERKSEERKSEGDSSSQDKLASELYCRKTSLLPNLDMFNSSVEFDTWFNTWFS